MDNTIKIFDPVTLKCVRTVKQAHQGETIYSIIQINADTIATGGNDKKIRFWKLPEMQEIGQQLNCVSQVLSLLKFNEKFILSGDFTGLVCLWSIETKNITKQWLAHRSQMFNNAVTLANKDRFLTRAKERTIKVWSINSDKSLLILKHTTSVCNCC